MTQVISLVSQKGGVGKSSSAINLAHAFAIGGYKVLIIDFDSQGSIKTGFGVSTTSNLGCKELLTKNNIPIKNFISTTEHKNLDIICSNIFSPTDEKTIFQICNKYNVLNDSLKKRAKDYDIIMLDAPASTNSLVINIMYATDYILLPLQCEKFAVASLSRFLNYFQVLQSQIKNKNIKLAGLLMTMFKKNSTVHRRVCEQIYDTLGDSVFRTIIPFDEALIESHAFKKPIFSYKMNSASATAYIELMKEIAARYSLHKN
jgi:chromosome partitioning protein